MKTAISDDEARLLKVAQCNFDDANRHLFAAETCVARVLKISHHAAAELLKRHSIDREIAESGVEIYQQEHCRSSWPDTQTFSVWCLMVTGAFFSVWLACVV